MATSTQVTVEEYLRTCYRPGREYVDGDVAERNVFELRGMTSAGVEKVRDSLRAENPHIEIPLTEIFD